MNIQNIAIQNIVPYHNNARRNDKTQIALDKSISGFGFNQPLVVREIDDGKYEIVVGDARFKTLKKMGADTISCVVAELTEDQAKQYRIGDNTTSDFSSWDEAKLMRELQVMENPFEMNDFFANGVERLLGDYATDSSLSSLPKAEVLPEKNQKESVPEKGSDTPIYENNSEVLKESNTVSTKEEQRIQKQNEVYRQMMANIEHEKMIKNRQYREIICPKCGKKLLIGAR